MGSRFFTNDHDNIFKKGSVFQFNFDMISCICHKKNRIEYFKSHGVIVRKKLSPILSKYIELAAKKQQIEVNGFHLSTGAHSDTVPFHLRNFDAIDITTRAASLYTHTKHDTLDKIDPKILVNTCDLAKNTILMIDNDYKMLCENNEIVCEMK
jgi:Zn-dependent M28 family amino/carboxypeptidase